mmetsp:Transcript_62140/g.182191  ORF Transcript_62140/g.182191 Transcript_62140/m.182191 type:complete len:302 (-) Transcript_62140:2241-3146(-)
MMRAPPPTRMVGCPRRAAARCLHSSTSASKKTQTTSLAGGLPTTSSHSARSRRVRLQRSTTMRAFPCRTRGAVRSASSSHLLRPRSSWLTRVHSPLASRASQKVDLPLAARPHISTYFGERRCVPFSRLWASLSSRFARAAPRPPRPSRCAPSSSASAAAAPSKSRAPSSSPSSCSERAELAARSSGGAFGASAARRQRAAANSRMKRSCRSVSTLPGRCSRRCWRTSSDCIGLGCTQPSAASRRSASRTPCVPKRSARQAATAPARPLPPPQCTMTFWPAAAAAETASTTASICGSVGGW